MIQDKCDRFESSPCLRFLLESEAELCDSHKHFDTIDCACNVAKSSVRLSVAIYAALQVGNRLDSRLWVSSSMAVLG
jgi:hypothetical protein